MSDLIPADYVLRGDRGLVAFEGRSSALSVRPAKRPARLRRRLVGEVVSAELVGEEWQLAVQTTATMVGCAGCGVRGAGHPARPTVVRVRDLPAGGRPVVLPWRKRIWRCRESVCKVRTWTERVTGIAPRAVLSQRARAEACRRVGKDAHAAYVSGLVDLERGRLLDVVAERTRAAVDGWLDTRSRDWLAQVGAVALDPWRGYASALVAPLGHATVVADHFHVIRLANLVVDQVRRRTQQATLGQAASAIRCTASASCC